MPSQGQIELITPAGDSAMDDTADAAKVLPVTDDGSSAMDDTSNSAKVTVVDPAGTNIGNAAVTALASTSRSTTTNSSDMTNPGARGIWLVLNITAATGSTQTLDCKLQRKEEGVSDVYVDLPDGAWAQASTAGSAELIVYPGVAETANVSVSDALTRTWRAVATFGGTSPVFTFSIAGNYIQ